MGNIISNDDLIQSHGMTVSEIRFLGEVQAGKRESPFRKITPNKAHLLRDPLFIQDGHDKYLVQEPEDRHYHLIQEQRSFNPLTGERYSRSFIQIYSIESFEFMKKHNGFLSYSVCILHDPTSK